MQAKRSPLAVRQRVKVDAGLQENVHQRNVVIHLCPEIPSKELQDISRIKLYNACDSI